MFIAHSGPLTTPIVVNYRPIEDTGGQTRPGMRAIDQRCCDSISDKIFFPIDMTLSDINRFSIDMTVYNMNRICLFFIFIFIYYDYYDYHYFI